MRFCRLLARLVLALAAVVPSARAAVHDFGPGALLVLCYHDVVDDVHAHDDPHAVSTTQLIAHFSWLYHNGFTPVSVAQLIAAKSGGPALPPKAVLLSFDDGYRSLYTRVFPLLRLYDFPALVAIVGSWLEVPPGALVPYEEGKPVPRDRFVRWNELREMVRSGLVEVASHSHDLHRGVLGNARGNTQPAATTRIFDPRSESYEGDDAYRARIRADLQANSDLIERELGVRPRTIAWPFGSYTHASAAIARELGMPVGLTLDDGFNPPDQPLERMRRMLIEKNPSAQNLAWSLQNVATEEPRRIVHVALDDLFDPDPQQQERRLSRVLDRLQRLDANTIVLNALSTGDGRPPMSYFPTRSLPVRADLFNRAAWQMITRLRVQVLARLPIRPGTIDDDRIAALYADLAKHAQFTGLYFEPEDAARSHVFLQAALAHRAPLSSMLAIDPRQLDRDETPSAALAAALKRHHQVVMVLPARGLDGQRIPDTIRAAAAQPEGLKRVVIELALEATQKDHDSVSGALDGLLRQIKRLGAQNVGYRTDSPHDDFPRLEAIRGSLSLRAYPQ